MNTAPLCTLIMVTLFVPFLGAIPDAYAQIPEMLCNPALFTDDPLFADTLSEVTDILMTAAAAGRGEYPFIAGSCWTNFFFEASCKESLGTQGCTGCFSAILASINNMCKNNKGVQAAFQECNLRYETYSFDQLDEKLMSNLACL